MDFWFTYGSRSRLHLSRISIDFTSRMHPFVPRSSVRHVGVGSLRMVVLGCWYIGQAVEAYRPSCFAI